MPSAQNERNCPELLTEKFAYIFDEMLIKEICANGKWQHFKEDDIIIEIGMPIQFFPIIISGSAKVLTEDKEDNDLLLYYLELGETCAITLNCCAQSAKSNIKAIAETDVEVIFIPQNKLDEWMSNYPQWRAFILESYHSRLNEMLAAIDNLAFNNMEERLLKYLKDKTLINRSMEINITHSEIANDLHSSRVVVSRLMKKFEKEGILQQHRNKITITALKRLS